MSLGMIFSSVALGISFLLTIIKFIDWFIHADPKAIIRAGQWSLVGFVALSLPGLIALLLFQQWTLAMILGAGMLALPSLMTWRAFIPSTGFWRLRAMGDYSGRARAEADNSGPDAETVRRAASVLAAYLERTGSVETTSRTARRRRPDAVEVDGTMDADEARAILGLGEDATAAAVRAAHRRLMQRVHPDRGGSNYLAAKTNRAKDVLLAELSGTTQAAARRHARAAAKRPRGGDARA